MNIEQKEVLEGVLEDWFEIEDEVIWNALIHEFDEREVRSRINRLHQMIDFVSELGLNIEVQQYRYSTKDEEEIVNEVRRRS